MPQIILFAIIAFLIVLSTTLYLRLRRDTSDLKKLENSLEEAILKQGISLPLFYKHGEDIVCNKAFEHAFGSFGKECIKTISSLPRSGEHPIELIFDNAVAKQTLVYITPFLYINASSSDFLALIVDVQFLHSSKSTLLLHKERLELAIESLNEAIWDWDLKSDVVFYTPKWKSIMGYSDKDTPSTLNAWLNLVHSKDMALVNEYLTAHLDGKTDFFIVEHRVRHSDPLQWVKVTGKVTRGKNNQAIRMVGTLRDITQEKIKKVEYEYEQEYFHAFFEFLPSFAFIKDAQGYYLYMNQSYQKLIGFRTWKDQTAADLFDASTAHTIAEMDRLSLYEGSYRHTLNLPTQEGNIESFTIHTFLIDAGDEKLICGFSINKSFKQ